MSRKAIVWALCVWGTLVATAMAAPRSGPGQIAPPDAGTESLIGDPEGESPPPAKAAQDTVWIADWSFDAGAGVCTSTGWVKYDNRIENNGSHYWILSNAFADSFGIVGRAALLRRHYLCWEADGYGNNADYSIVLKYRGTGATLAFRYLADTEPTYDYVHIEADSGGASEARVNYNTNPTARPEHFREELAVWDGESTELFGPISLPDFGVPATTHEVYIRFTSDAGASDEDGFFLSRWHAALVVDNIAVTGALAYTETFEGALGPNVQFVNSAPATPFGLWARLFFHITDNDKCSENFTCAWLQTDPTRISFFPDMGFGPGQAIVRNWLDDIYVSPWVSLASTPSASGTVLSFRRFGGNRFSNSRIVQGWRVRSKARRDNTDTTTPGDSIDCLSGWGHAFDFNSLDSFSWGTAIFDMTSEFSAQGREIQVSFRTSDWQLITGIVPPVPLNPGPGPYVDRVRIGRRVLAGPVIDLGIDTRFQAQDCFPTVLNGIVPGEHFSPAASDIFGTCAFSQAADLGINTPGSPNLITGDSIVANNIVDSRNVGGVTLVRWYGAIVSGPHAGKAPSPYTVAGNGFFQVTPDSARAAFGAVIEGSWFVDLDDTYFRGGDVLRYFWYAGDAAGGRTSSPGGIGTTLPASVAAAETATGGLWEVNYLPKINWAAPYLSRIAADPHGDLAPTALELAASSQANCILYYQHATSARRSGIINRTSFMYTLDRLGYQGRYDVYDVQGYGNTNNQLGGRASVPQFSRYAMIIEDDGRSLLTPNIPDGNPMNRDTEKVNQAQWYRDYLAQGVSSLAGIATLWVIGESTAFEKSTNLLFTTTMGLSSIVTDQGLNVNPNVTGQASFTFTTGGTGSFTADFFALNGGCPAQRNYDGATNTGTAVLTHRYTVGPSSGAGAVVMNKNNTLKWNTIWMGFGWFDIRNAFGQGPGSPNGAPDIRLARKVMNAALPVSCSPGTPVDTGDPELAAPRVSQLHQNVPNPFNPVTVIHFDLAQDGLVELRIFDVAGRQVRTLAQQPMRAGARHTLVWNGLDDEGVRAPSGVYFYRLVTLDYRATRKMVLLQ